MALTPYGKLIRKLRINADITLEDMAKAAGKHRPYLSMVENGRHKVPTDLIKIAIKMLGEQHRDAIESAAKLSNLMYTGKISIGTENLSEEKLRLALLFATKLKNLSDATIGYIEGLLLGSE